MRKIVLSFLFITFIAMNIVAQNQQKPCTGTEASQFDFWLGEWDLEWKTAKGTTQNGTNVVTRILGGCVIQENFDGGKELKLKGISHSMFDAVSGSWKQTWVDDSGSYLDFTGGMNGKSMTLAREFTTEDGKKRKQRMVFFNIQKDSLEWNWENSTDGGKTWNLAWHIKYRRKK